MGGDGHVHHVVNPDPYRSPFAGTPEEIATKSVADIRSFSEGILRSAHSPCVGMPSLSALPERLAAAG